MTAAELIARLQEFPPDWDVLVLHPDWDGLAEVIDVSAWLHFQTDTPLGGIVLEPSDSVV